MSDDNKWSQPASPPPPLFTGKKEKDFVKQVNDEIIETLSRDGNRLDSYTKAHLSDARAMIDRVLDSNYIYNQASSDDGGGSPFAMLFGQRD